MFSSVHSNSIAFIVYIWSSVHSNSIAFIVYIWSRVHINSIAFIVYIWIYYEYVTKPVFARQNICGSYDIIMIVTGFLLHKDKIVWTLGGNLWLSA